MAEPTLSDVIQPRTMVDFLKTCADNLEAGPEFRLGVALALRVRADLLEKEEANG